MSDPQKLSDLKKRHDKIEEQYRELLSKRAYDLGLPGIAGIELALEDDSAMKPFPVEFDPLRLTYARLIALDKAIKEEQEKPLAP